MMKLISNKKLVSSDIFDTLIFRTVSKPKDIFNLVEREYFKKYNEKLDYNYMYIRKLAETSAREKEPSKEVSFNDIMKKLPYDDETKKRLAKLEFMLEKKHLALNMEIYQFLLDCKNQGITIVLLSDMYFSSSQIREILEFLECDMDIFDEIIVSCDYKASKANQKLYKVLKGKYASIPTEQMVHLGDNYYSDFVAAKNENIEAIHYATFLETMDSIYALEEGWGGESVHELRSLRKKMKYAAGEYTDSESKMYNLGAQIFGPIYSLYIEWIIDYAEKKGIKKICPLMREGKLFGEMLNNIIKLRNLDMHVEPLYVSRKATYLPSLTNFNQVEKKELLGRKMLNLEDLFNILLIPIEETVFEKYRKKKLNEIYDIKVENINLFVILERYLDEDQVVSRINENIHTQKKYLKEYLTSKIGSEPFITVDLAGHGSIQSQINKVLNTKETAHHLMMLARIETLKKIIDGHQFLAWLGYDDYKNPKIGTFFRSPEIIEAITNICEAGTSHYRKEALRIIPVQTNTMYSEEIVYNQQICWEGIYKFQLEWFYLDKSKNLKEDLLQKSDAFLNIFYRLINYPLYEEAKLLGALLQDDQSHYSRTTSIISESDKQLLNSVGTEDFLAFVLDGYSSSGVYWPQGVVTLEQPNYFLLKYFEEKQMDNSFAKIYTLISKISKENYDKICVYGAGQIGKKILTLAKPYGLNITAFIDRNYDKITDYMDGIPVYNIDYLDETVDLVIIGSQAFYKEIKDNLLVHYRGKKTPIIIGL